MSSGSGRPRLDIHLCQECGRPFEGGVPTVCLSDGYTDYDGEYEVENRRFFHADCWKNSQYLHTESDDD